MTNRMVRLLIIFMPYTRENPLTLLSPSEHPPRTSSSGIVPAFFPVLRMLFTAVEARRVQYDKLTENDTVAAAAHDFPAAFEIILQVLPGTKTIAIVNGASPNEAFWQGVLQRELEPLSKRVKIKWYNELSFEEMLKDAANLPPNSAIFWHLLSVDAAGVAHEANAALHRFSAAANAPIFSYLDVWFGEAILGGSMQSAQEGSAVAAAAAIRILDGEKAGDVKIPPTHFTPPRFDWRQMQRFGISDSDLPRGSEIYFREPTVWQRYPEQIATSPKAWRQPTVPLAAALALPSVKAFAPLRPSVVKVASVVALAPDSAAAPPCSRKPSVARLT